MRVTISASASENIDKIYLDESEKLCEYLASNGCDLNWGSGSVSIMGVCYNTFVKYNRKIYGYVTKKYFYDIANLPEATHTKFEDTLELKRSFYLDADLYICLPGGLGSISELLAFLEDARSNDNETPIVVYNINHHFDSTIALLDDLVNRGFNSTSVYNYFKVINTIDEFKDYYESLAK